jgi:hypothetical protein
MQNDIATLSGQGSLTHAKHPLGYDITPPDGSDKLSQGPLKAADGTVCLPGSLKGKMKEKI